MDDPITKEFYLGSRECECKISDDIYMGSYKKWNPADKTRLVKTILETDFNTRLETYNRESDMIREVFDNPLNRNYDIPDEKFTYNRTGILHTDKTKGKISTSLKEYYKTHEPQLSFLGKSHTDETKQKMSESAMGHLVSESTKQKLREANLGNSHTDETKKKISENHARYNLNRQFSKETCSKMSISAKNQKKYKCPHCDVVGIKGNMNRWHFDNCKYKK